MKWLRDWVNHRVGLETYEEAYARIWAEMERAAPRPQTEDERIVHNLTAMWNEEQRRKRLDGPNGEYKRGVI